MKSIDLTQFDWNVLQKNHDNGESINSIRLKIGISNTVMNKAIKLGYIIRKHSKALPISYIQKEKISEKLKLAHKEGRHSGWSHINSRLDRLSYPERFFKNVLINEGIFDNYQIEQQLPIGKYFLDFAFIELKLVVEIDGSQHYNTQEAIEHDKIRDTFLKERGWKIYRIAWSQLSNNTQLEINNFLIYLNNIDNETDHYYQIEDIILKRKPKYGTRKEYVNQIKSQYIIKQQKYIDLIKKSSIDFKKYGWVGQVAILIKRSPQKVNEWMKRFLPEIYEYAFKRKI